MDGNSVCRDVVLVSNDSVHGVDMDKFVVYDDLLDAEGRHSHIRI
jgi:hypothetical protein